MNKKQLRKRVLTAIEENLTDKGYRVADRDFLGFMVAYEGKELVFLSVEPCFGDFPDREVTRKEFEDACVAWLIDDNQDEPCAVRCDLVDVRIVTDGTAFTRQEVNHMRLY